MRIGAGLILVAVRYLGKLLKQLMVGKARDALISAVGRNAYPSAGGSSPSI